MQLTVTTKSTSAPEDVYSVLADVTATASGPVRSSFHRSGWWTCVKSRLGRPRSTTPGQVPQGYRSTSSIGRTIRA